MKSENEIREYLKGCQVHFRFMHEGEIRAIEWVLEDSEPEEIEELRFGSTWGRTCDKINELICAVNKLSKARKCN